MKKWIDLKLAGLLALLTLFGLITGLPYVKATLGDKLVQLDVPLSLILTLQTVQGTIVAFVLALVGLKTGKYIGLDSPILRAFVSRTAIPKISMNSFLKSIGWGLAATAIVLVLELGIFKPLLSNENLPSIKVKWWEGMLTAFQGGIFEEVLLRLFLATLIIWVLSKWFGRRAVVYWIGIIAAALLFGVGHLPAAKLMFGSLTDIMIIRVIVLNSIAGIIYGWLYWKKGLEHAIVAHMVGDIVLHGIMGS
ncbi:CPBP family intramembrane glutamic endopeptidase [Paenibacillus sediminis]|uniref:Membrane protease YdiL (CAAX protease family) n=1 Tax=Paenibacillus sediminis TaxID=664909 RepID=A0ABS4H0K0_9BACL|nr:CPBP family intramembrane glutamic endopeptidase [Paenibacillus sediminis]MBP1936062.1 membrane protease YdiL (CAAX protease family) [Paenibacillus sediminis]